MTKEKKKLLEVKPRSDADKSPMYLGQVLHFSLVSSPTTGRRQCTPMLSCRDYLHEAVRSYVGRDSKHRFSSHYAYKKSPPIDMDALRMLLATDLGGKKSDKYKDKLFSGKRLLNFYEEVAGWKKSRITTVKHRLMKNAWLVTGPKNWMAHPSLLSMVSFIFRISAMVGPVEFSDRKSLNKWFQEKATMDKNSIRQGSGVRAEYLTYLADCWPKLYFIMKHHKELFPDNAEESYCSDGRSLSRSFHARMGIHSLCTLTTPDQELNSRMASVIKRELEK